MGEPAGGFLALGLQPLKKTVEAIELNVVTLAIFEAKRYGPKMATLMMGLASRAYFDRWHERRSD